MKRNKNNHKHKTDEDFACFITNGCPKRKMAFHFINKKQGSMCKIKAQDYCNVTCPCRITKGLSNVSCEPPPLTQGNPQPKPY